MVIQGDVTAKGRLRVEGWLIADNVKVSNKGLFQTLEELVARYPSPHDGWWALVGESLPADIYVARGGAWEATGGQGGSESIDIARYDGLIEELQNDAIEASQEITTLKEKDASLDEAITALSTSLSDNFRGLSEEISGLSIAHSMDKTALGAEITTLKEKDVSLDEAITVLGTKVSNVNKALGSQKTELEKRIGVLAFDGYVDAQEDAEGEAIGTVWYSPDQSCFVVVEAGGITSFCVHNDRAKDWLQARTDCLFISSGQLLVFDGENLVNWEPEIMRDDITDLSDALSKVEDKVSTLEDFARATSMRFTEVEDRVKEVGADIAAVESSVTDVEERVGDVAHEVSEHIAEVAIYAFNGFGVPTDSSAITGMDDGIYYSATEGLFYKTTSGSPSLSVPHNANGKARTDCLYRKGNVLYQYNGSTLSEYVSPSVATELAELRSLIANLG